MPAILQRLFASLVVAGLVACSGIAGAADIGRIKIVKGVVTVQRAGQALPASVGMGVEASDVVRTGPDGSVGITMTDNAMLSAGPNSAIALERYEFDATTGRGRFETALERGSLAVVSGRIAKQSPDAMTVRTPFAVLGVRGTEFAVSAHGPVLTLP